MVMALEPKLILLDEPTAGLTKAGADHDRRHPQGETHEGDSGSRRSWSNTISTSCAQISSRIVVLHQGRLVPRRVTARRSSPRRLVQLDLRRRPRMSEPATSRGLATRRLATRESVARQSGPRRDVSSGYGAVSILRDGRELRASVQARSSRCSARTAWARRRLLKTILGLVPTAPRKPSTIGGDADSGCHGARPGSWHVGPRLRPAGPAPVPGPLDPRQPAGSRLRSDKQLAPALDRVFGYFPVPGGPAEAARRDSIGWANRRC